MQDTLRSFTTGDTVMLLLEGLEGLAVPLIERVDFTDFI